MTRLAIAAQSHTGLVREHNEDNFGFDAASGLVVLADGMGGYRAGEVASAVAVTALFQSLPQLLAARRPGNAEAQGDLAVLGRAVEHANRQVLDLARSDHECGGMGTTLTAGWFHGDRLSIAHVGDSRLYRYRDYRLAPVTMDHTVVQELVNHGFYTHEEAKTSVQRNIVTRALGIDSQVQIDLFDVDVLGGDIYLFCSDGLNDMIDDREIGNILRRSSTDLDYGAEELVKQALDNGGKDNVTVLLVRVDGGSPPSRRGWIGRLLGRNPPRAR